MLFLSIIDIYFNYEHRCIYMKQYRETVKKNPVTFSEPGGGVSGEGPRSRRYGRTAAMRLIVQPYDEDVDDDYFLSFS
jgi:hypothetical protein